jgi:hypothetical protein
LATNNQPVSHTLYINSSKKVLENMVEMVAVPKTVIEQDF